MAALSKRMASLTEKVTDKDPVSVTEAVELLKSFGALKFDQSVEIAMRLGIDPKQADQIVRGSIVLPHGIGRTKRVVVFAKGAAADAAREAGADEVGADELAKKIKDGWLDSAEFPAWEADRREKLSLLYFSKQTKTKKFPKLSGHYSGRATSLQEYFTSVKSVMKVVVPDRPIELSGDS